MRRSFSQARVLLLTLNGEIEEVWVESLLPADWSYLPVQVRDHMPDGARRFDTVLEMSKWMIGNNVVIDSIVVREKIMALNVQKLAQQVDHGSEDHVRQSMRAMQGLVDDVAVFHKAAGLGVKGRPTFPDIRVRELRKSLIHEEAEVELMQAINTNDIVEIADGIADAIYVLIGTALEYGVPLAEVWAEVQRSNMSKVDPDTGKVQRREDGKILKGRNYSPPDVEGVLQRAMDAD